MGISLEYFKASREILINPQKPAFVNSRRCCGTAGMGSARTGQKEKRFAGQICFCAGRELRAEDSEIPIIPKLCLEVWDCSHRVDLGTPLGAVLHREPIF